MINVKNLKKSFGSVKAVDGLTFNIKKGEIVGFLGPNGAGKTTTMRLITGYMSPDSGSVTIDGLPINQNLRVAQTKIGYLPENNPVYAQMLVSEMLDLSAQLKNIPKSKRKSALDFVVQAVAIDDVFYRPIGQLSKGYKQRVGMATALLHKPKILIMDEPTEGLDPNQRTEIRALIKDLAKDRTILLSTHVMQEATAVVSRILIINDGKLVADGSPDKLISLGKEGKIIKAQIEGTKILSSLKTIKSINKLTSKKLTSKKYELDIYTNTNHNLQPQLSKLAAKHNWTIWKLVEQETNLEEVFHQLTQKQP